MLKYLSVLLYPFSLLYGLVMWVRNKLYDRGMLTAVEFDIPTIAAGNLSVGGTGKTPHVEYLIRLLKQQFQVATLSRGYNRRTSGYILADTTTTALEIGDEPMQFHQKYPDIRVAVGEERMLAIPQLLMDEPDTQVVLLDDAFQHRSIKPGMNILITEYNRRFTRDHVVPFGRLREGRNGYHRANCIIVSKCPPELSLSEKAAIEKEIAPLPHQQVFFTTLQYGAMYDLITQEPVSISPDTTVLLACGIARPEPLLDKLRSSFSQVYLLAFPDHYYYSEKDIAKIIRERDGLPGNKKMVVTTEKDAVRLHLLQKNLTEQNMQMAVMPIEIAFLFDGAERFNNFIFDYVGSFYPTANQ
ncbi:tetraacyldisaccharide 4'-kinase [Chitinophaga sp. sic0106]|uniref:tetraacyldisaccharide 4'-kinase n=1 Tax=Chitinophaga sp. sic0106 TaxID=2854785 RepID=UPI001C48D009|nr:tetraacyldisaccharide 4'-kinase [Chitinophaga sp. sic0106]